MKNLIIAMVVAMLIAAPGKIQAYPHSGGGYGGSYGGHGGGYYGHGGGNYYGHGGGYYGHGGGYYGGGYYGGWGWGLPVAAFATGALLSSAYYSQPYYYGSPYYADAPVYRPRVVYSTVHRTVAVPRSGLDLDVQTALRTKGYYTGALDGVYGPQTADAIRKFQVDNGIAMTGKINGDTLKALGL
jgi:hypothetical protein